MKHSPLLRNRVISAANQVAGRLGLLDRPLLAGELIASAEARVHIEANFDASVEEALAMLLESYNREAALSIVGHLAARWDTLRLLTNLLTFQDEEARTPSILDEPIRAPIFITGMPRSGTTFLHGILAEDPANRVPRCWQTVYPYPRRRGTPGDPERADAVQKQLRLFELLAPDFHGLHPLDARAPQECSEITSHVFQSLRFDATHRMPGYRAWLDQAGHEQAYRFHKRFLQHLQHQVSAELDMSASRWVLKCPDHVMALDTIAATYPDARLVFLHRDPLKVLPSVAQLTVVLREPFSRSVDKHDVGAQVSRHWQEGAARLVAAKHRPPLPPSRILHLRYLDFVANPFAAVQLLYSAFDLRLSTLAAERMHAFIAARPRGGYKAHRYDFATFGLDPQSERMRHQEYMATFGIEPESPQWTEEKLAA